MAFTNRNNLLDGRQPTLYPSGGEVVAQRAEISLVTADLGLNDCGAVSVLPAGLVPVGVIYDSTDLDTNASPTITAQVGLLNADESDLSEVWVSGIQASRDGSAVQVVSTAMIRTAAAATDRKVGVKFSAAAATPAAGTLGITLLMRSA